MLPPFPGGTTTGTGTLSPFPGKKIAQSKVGSLSSRYESSGNPGAIGYDTTGGWSNGGRFASSTPQVKKSVFNRFFGKDGELSNALRMLKNDPIGTIKNVFSDPVKLKVNLPTKQNLRTPTQEERNKMVQELPIMKALNTPTAKKVITQVANKTDDGGLKFISAVEALGTQKTFRQAYDGWKKKAQDPENNELEKLLYSVQSAGPQSVLGVLLSFVPRAGVPLSTAYWAALSADEQLEKKGKIDDIAPISIDVVGDRLLGSSIERMFKMGAQPILKALGKTGIIEGGTEVSQTILKLTNDYQTATTPEDKKKAIQQMKEYITSGNIAREFATGFTVGAGVGAGARVLQTQMSQEQNQVNVPPAQQTKPVNAVAPVAPVAPVAKLAPFPKASVKPQDAPEQEKRVKKELISDPTSFKTADDYVKAQGTTGNELKDLGNDITKKYDDTIFIREKVNLNDLSQTDHFEAGEYKQPYFKEMLADAKKGKELPPIVVDKNGSIIDGNHRLEAYLNAKRDFQYVYKETSKTRSQLIEEWNKANQDSLPEKPVVKVSKASKESTEFQSRVFERMKAENPELQGEATAERVRLKEDADRAVDLVLKDKQKAYDIAVGREVSPDILQTSANIALSEKAIEEGNYKLASELLIRRSLDQTRRGQELVAERGSIADNSTSKYVKQLIASRMDNLGKKYFTNLTGKVRRLSNKGKANEVIEKEVAKVEQKIKTKKLSMNEALSLLDKLQCL
ncbi:MAG: ParB N-terminal domain-containing protein [Candidatus Paceibacterota bacterium]